MPFTTPVVPLALGSIAAAGANRLYKWGDSRYINSGPIGPGTATSARTAMRPRSQTMTKRKRRTKRRYGIKRRRIPRALQSPSKLVRGKVVANYSVTNTTGGIQTYPFKLFDLTDPTGTLGSQQFLGYDQWKTLYKKAVSLGVKITVRCHNKGTYAIMFGITPMAESQGSSGLTSYNHYMELAGTKSKLLSQDVDHSVLTHKVGTARHVGVRKLRDEDQFHVDLVNEAGPNRDAYFHVFVQPVDQTNTNQSELVVTLDYLILLWDPVVPSRSSDT